MSSNQAVISDIVAIVKVDPAVDLAVIGWRERVLQLSTYAGALVIDSPGMVELAAEDLAKIKTLRDTIEVKRKEIGGPLDQQVRRINLLFKELSNPLGDADSIIREKVKDYRAAVRQAEVERLAAEREEARVREQERVQRMVDSPGKAVEQPERPLILTVPPIEQPKSVATASGKLSGRMVWKFRVIDMAALPDQYKLVNEQMLRGLATSSKGSMEIPGVEFYQEEQLSVSDRYQGGI